MNRGAVTNPGTYFFVILAQTMCHRPFANIRIANTCINTSLNFRFSNRKTPIQNPRNRISKVRKTLRLILNGGNLL